MISGWKTLPKTCLFISYNITRLRIRGKSGIDTACLWFYQKIGFIIPKHQSVGISSLSSITLKSLTNIPINMSGEFLINSFNIKSIPPHLLFFNVFIAFFTSISVRGSFKIVLSMLMSRFGLSMISSPFPEFKLSKCFLKVSSGKSFTDWGGLSLFIISQKSFGGLELRLRICFAILLLYLLNDVLISFLYSLP